MKTDLKLLEELENLAARAAPGNLGDIVVQAITIKSRIVASNFQALALIPMDKLTIYAIKAEYGWKLFANPPTSPKPLNDNMILQLFAIEMALDELCYACQQVEISAAILWGSATPTRFYLNSIYQYITSLFLVDKEKKSHKGLGMGGTVIRGLQPMGLDGWLAPIRAILVTPFGNNVTFGDAIRRLRNASLVHGTHSPDNVEQLVEQTRMREPRQQQLLTDLVRDLYYQALVLRLKVVALLTATDISLEAVVTRYLHSIASMKADGTRSTSAHPE